ncbi:uncharacterized protein LOC114530511 isoform X2 [Dendronephthya gigantea]|uniref:uncharacterized protein LOC114530511 isoform X2 n=1 Tax=Dendronephthya gigantea TaxID=151771 RepID=UPI00106A04DD|nr:uncharacterized protein LOC114530511 isoform X2 [Dendronephthya gigantea]
MNGQKLLDNAIFYERRKNWKKVIFFYNDLFELFKNETFANLQKLAPEELKILKFQCYHHCGVAHQKLNDHNTAILMFREAIRIVEKRKDMYCIRAIVRFMLGDNDKAIEDTTLATEFNSQHVCSLILRGWFERSLKESPLTRGMGGLHENRKWNKFEAMAYELNPSVVSCFGDPCSKENIIEVLEKYLPTVRCPHTVTVYDVCQVAQPSFEIPKTRSGNAKIEKMFPDSDTRRAKTSFVTNQSQIDTSETNCKASLTNFDTRQTEISFATTDSKQSGSEEIFKDGGKVSECCKGCSSVEEFLKHLIWSEDTNSAW